MTARNGEGQSSLGLDRSDAPIDHPLGVLVDARCLEDTEMRGFARYTLEILYALALRPTVQLHALATRPLSFAVPCPVEVVAGKREIWTEQVLWPCAARRLGADVMWCPANRGLPLAVGCPTVLTLHDAVEWRQEFTQRASLRQRCRFGYSSVVSLASATRVITVSHASALSIETMLSVDSSRVRVIREAASSRLHLDGQLDLEHATATLKRLNVTSRYFLFVGGFDAKKDVMTLVRARERLGEDAPPVVLVGSLSDDAKRVREIVDERCSPGAIRFVGEVSDADLAILYRKALCFVTAARAEGFGLPVAEAMAAGLPVIACRAAAIPETLGDAGMYFDPGDDRQLATLLRSMADDRLIRGRLRSAALTQSRRFSWSHAAEETEAVLREASEVRPWQERFERVRRLRSWRQWATPR